MYFRSILPIFMLQCCASISSVQAASSLRANAASRGLQMDMESPLEEETYEEETYEEENAGDISDMMTETEEEYNMDEEEPPEEETYEEENAGDTPDMMTAIEEENMVSEEEPLEEEIDEDLTYEELPVMHEVMEPEPTDGASEELVAQATLSMEKMQFLPSEPVKVSFSTGGVDASGWTVGIYMHMANPQDGTLLPIVYVRACGDQPECTEGTVEFGGSDEMTFTGYDYTGNQDGQDWPLVLQFGYDFQLLDENGGGMAPPVMFTFNGNMERERILKVDH